MPLLMHIAFANDERLSRRVYYLEYSGVRFKLIQNNPRKHADVLLSIVPKDDDAAQQKAYGAAGEFLSALAWQNQARIALENAGGVGVPATVRLRQAHCAVFAHPRIPFGGHHAGKELSVIPRIETDAQRIALALFREATSSNKVWLSFLFLWQILEVGGNNAVGWVDSRHRRRQIQLTQHEARLLALGGHQLGSYLKDRGRDAIAHIRRRPGSHPFRFDVREDNVRMAVSTTVIKRFAERYIREDLDLRRKLHLVRRCGRGFPTYVDEAVLRSHHSVLAYP